MKTVFYFGNGVNPQVLNFLHLVNFFSKFNFKIIGQKNCQYSNGSMISDEFLPYSCISQTFRSCADIKIVSNPNHVSSVYVPNPFKQVKESNDKIFQCLNYHEHSDQAKLVPFQSPNTRPDPYKFTGIFLFNLLILFF